jgi:hypothetical protein
MGAHLDNGGISLAAVIVFQVRQISLRFNLHHGSIYPTSSLERTFFPNGTEKNKPGCTQHARTVQCNTGIMVEGGWKIWRVRWCASVQWRTIGKVTGEARTAPRQPQFWNLFSCCTPPVVERLVPLFVHALARTPYKCCDVIQVDEVVCLVIIFRSEQNSGVVQCNTGLLAEHLPRWSYVRVIMEEKRIGNDRGKP